MQRAVRPNAKGPAKPKRPAHRPTKYSPELGLKICDAIAGGLSLTKAAAKFSLPAETVCRWTVRHPDFRQQYMQARDTRADLLAEQCLDIADDAGQDWQEGRNGKKRLDREAVLRSRLRVDARQWQMARLDPQQWGDRQQVDMKHDWSHLSEEERVRKAMDLLGVVRGLVEREKQMQLEAANGPRRILYDPTDGDELAEQEQRQRREREKAELAEEQSPGGIGVNSAWNPRPRWR
jgi:hypothetical protein